MTEITYIKGNLFERGEQVIIHGCNAKGKFRSGVAGVIRAMYPKCYDAYYTHYLAHGLKVGELIPYHDPSGLVIYNAITQPSFGYEGNQYVDYQAIETAMLKCDAIVNSGRIAMPKIGAGLGGGDWDIISEIIENSIVRNNPVVYLLD